MTIRLANRDPDATAAFWLTSALMLLWFWTPLGKMEMDTVSWIASRFPFRSDVIVLISMFTWPTTAITFFHLVRIMFRRRRLRQAK